MKCCVCVLKGRSRLRQADTWLGAETWCWPSKEEAEGWQAGSLIQEGLGTAGGDVTDVECWSQQKNLFLP